MKAIVEYFISKSIFVNLLTGLIILVGSYTAATMNREAFPNINFDIVTVITLYPGASPGEVEKLVTNPIEESIKSVDGIKEYRSSSIENRSGIVITIDPNVENSQKVIDDIKTAVDRTEDLPEDSEKPVITEVTTSRQPVIEVNVSFSEDKDFTIEQEKALRIQAKFLEDALLDIPGVGRVVRRGWRDTEMHVNINPSALDHLSLSTQQVINSLKNQNINFPGGNISGGGREKIIRTIGEFNLPEEIMNVYIRSNDAGKSIRIKDLATVHENFADSVYLDRVNGFKSIALTVIKKEKADAIKVVDEVKRVAKDYQGKAPPEIKVSFVNDLSFFIKRRLNVLTSNGIQGLILVAASLFFFLGWRVALMTALGIPVAIGSTFIVMNYMGITLNLISMFGLIIVVGILVDDAIVICENVYRYLEAGMDPYDAAVRGTSEVIAPVTGTITTTIAAFGPMLFMTGIFGKFMHTIPLVVIIALTSSMLEAFFILPSHLYDINKHKLHTGEIKAESGWFFRLKTGWYLPFLDWALNHKFRTIMLLNVAFVISFGILIAFGKFKLFPGAIETFQAKITAETGLELEETEKFARAIEFEIQKLNKGEVDNFVTRIGIIQKDPNDPFTKRGKNYGQVMVYLTPDSDRKRNTEEIMKQIREKTFYLLNENSLRPIIEREKMERDILRKKGKNIPEPGYASGEVPEQFKALKGRLTSLDFEKLAGGPPVGKPVAIEIRGDDFETLKIIASEFKGLMTKAPGVIDIADDFNDGKDEIRLKIDENLAARTGVSVAQIALAVNTAFQGTVATKIKRTDEEVEVRVRFPESYRKSIDSLKRIYVTNILGNLIPIANMATYVQAPGIASINHLDGKRLLTATANINEGVTTSAKANAEIKKLAGNLIDKYPGYRVRFGGENKDTEESMASLGRAFLVGFIIIFMILASLFRSFSQPFIVVAAIPFSFIGVILAFVLHNEYFSFLAFLGIIGLAGVVVNDSIVLVDFANQLRAENPKMKIFDVLMKTGEMRLRAVILTTVTTVLGLLPTAYGIGGKDPFLVPMALAFGWGLAFSTILTLIVVPVLYKMNCDFKDWYSIKFGKKDFAEVNGHPVVVPTNFQTFPENPEPIGPKKRKRN
ncbi:MAG: efflux RND transporter permease subunit [Leptospira sp.]|nr:efflux RND transporter permease subunit [Leptospira sp.]